MGRSWPIGLIGLCMVAFGIFGMWVVAAQGGVFLAAPDLPSWILSYALFGLIVVTGVWSLVIAVVRWKDDQAFVPGFLLAYRDAWRGFRGRRWLLALTGYLLASTRVQAYTSSR